MKNIKLISAGGILLAVVLLITANILVNVVFKSARVDLTDDNLYTLSQGTKNILDNLDEPVTFRFFFSEKLATGVPALMSYGRQVRELLEEYVANSGGNVKLVVLDPEPFSEYEDQAVEFGLQGVPIDNVGTTAYFGLVGTNATDDQEVIRFFQMEKEASLEYDITRLVYKLGNPKKSVIGLISTLPLEGGGPANPMMGIQPTPEWMITGQLKQLFEVRTLSDDLTKVPAEVDVLMLVHPRGLSEKTQFAIDQFILAGGRALIFVDPNAESQATTPDPQNPMAAGDKSSELNKLFEKWGIEMVKGQIAGDIKIASRVSMSQMGRPQSIDFVLWLQLQENNIARNDFVTGELNQITMATAGILKAKDGAETEFVPLLETTEQAMQIPVTSVQFRLDPVGLLNNFKPGGERLVLAGRVTGSVKSAFPDGHPDGDEGEWLKESKEAINVIVVADADMLEDRFWVNVQNFFGQRVAIPRANNGAFVVNAIENLSGSNDLISLRSRGNFSRPFLKVKEIQQDAEKQFRDKEKELQTKLRDTEQKIAELQRQKGSNEAMIVSPEQQKEIQKFRDERVKTRKELRSVQHELRKNIESLGSTLKFINIGLIPILIILVAIGLAVYRHKRMSRLAQ